MFKLGFKKLYPDAIIPSRSTKFSSGLDLCAHNVLKSVSIKRHYNMNIYEVHDNSLRLLERNIHSLKLNINERALIGTGVSVCAFDEYFDVNRIYDIDMQIRPRSGLGIHFGVHVALGTIDSDYNGEIGVIVFNFGAEHFTIIKDQKIAQLIATPLLCPNSIIELNELPETQRGTLGFGHTDNKTDL